jgi:hypothetical protein
MDLKSVESNGKESQPSICKHANDGLINGIQVFEKKKSIKWCAAVTTGGRKTDWTDNCRGVGNIGKSQHRVKQLHEKV